MPLAGFYCPGIIGPNTPSNFCGLRCISDGGAAGKEAVAGGGVEGRLAALELGQQEGQESPEAAGRRQEQERQERRLGVERSDVLSICMTLSLLGSA